MNFVLRRLLLSSSSALLWSAGLQLTFVLRTPYAPLAFYVCCLLFFVRLCVRHSSLCSCGFAHYYTYYRLDWMSFASIFGQFGHWFIMFRVSNVLTCFLCVLAADAIVAIQILKSEHFSRILPCKIHSRSPSSDRIWQIVAFFHAKRIVWQTILAELIDCELFFYITISE